MDSIRSTSALSLQCHKSTVSFNYFKPPAKKVAECFSRHRSEPGVFDALGNGKGGRREH